MGNTKYINVLSLCAGYAGLDIVLSRVLDYTLRVVAVEIEAYAQANLVAKAEEGKLGIEALYPDVKSFPGKRFSGCFDIITAGYPCQPFSIAGNREGKKDPRHLWPDIREHIRTIKPAMVFLENVSGHVSVGLKEVVFSLRRMGYKVEAGLFSAAETNGEHVRERIYILAYTNSVWQSQSKRYDQDFGRWFSNCVKAGVSSYSMCKRHTGVQRLQANSGKTEARGKGAARAIKESLNDSSGWRTWAVKPFLCGKDDACPDRSHRIRLLGNGIDIPTAEKAFRELLRLFE